MKIIHTEHAEHVEYQLHDQLLFPVDIVSHVLIELSGIAMNIGKSLFHIFVHWWPSRSLGDCLRTVVSS